MHITYVELRSHSKLKSCTHFQLLASGISSIEDIELSLPTVNKNHMIRAVDQLLQRLQTLRSGTMKSNVWRKNTFLYVNVFLHNLQYSCFITTECDLIENIISCQNNSCLPPWKSFCFLKSFLHSAKNALC